MNRTASRIVSLWLLFLAACVAIAWRSDYTADMSAFLPKTPSAEQQLLVDLLKDGVVSRTLLIGIQGGDTPGRARLSRELAQRMRASALFTSVSNGESGAMARDYEILLANRYLLGPQVNPQRFTVEGLRAAIGDTIDLLASPMGLMIKGLLPHDPTGELMDTLGSLGSGGPASLHGAWVSRDGQRAILMAQTRATGSDTDGQEAALVRIQQDFSAIRQASGVPEATLLVSGAPTFAVHSRATIRAEVMRLSLISIASITCLLLLVYRSFTALTFGLLPVLSGALAGVAAVSLGFGTVHGITIGFGTTLIGEAVDYSIYYLIQSQREDDQDKWATLFWPTIRLGVLTSVCGFAALLFSGFPGLSQLGLYSITGLAVAATVTRFVLPHLPLHDFSPPEFRRTGQIFSRLLNGLKRLRWAVIALAIAATLVLVAKQDTLWNNGLSGLNPTPIEAQNIDLMLRADLGAPDLRYLVVVSTHELESTLVATEKVSLQLQALVDAGVLSGFETPTRFLPSRTTQTQRQAALPERAELERRLRDALAGMPLQVEKLAPFLDEVETARHLPLMTSATLKDSTLALGVESLLLQRPSGWIALILLRPSPTASASMEIDAEAIQRALDAAKVPEALFVDIVDESTRLFDGYLNEAIGLSLAGFLAIALLLGVALRSARRMLRVIAPLIMAVLVVVAGLALAGERLILLHLVGMLLIVAVGSNYALFFDLGNRKVVDEARTLISLLLANAATVIGFGVLAFSQVPVLHALGITVGPGAILSLLFAAALSEDKKGGEAD
jgi:predicted exporter